MFFLIAKGGTLALASDFVDDCLIYMMSKNAFWCRDFPFDVCKDITIGKDYYEHPDSF